MTSSHLARATPARLRCAVALTALLELSGACASVRAASAAIPCASRTLVATLADALRQAACVSPEASSALASEQYAEAARDEAAAGLRPTLEARAGLEASRDLTTQPGQSTTTSLSAPSLVLSQTLYDSGATAAKTRQRNAELLAQRSASLATLRSVLSDLIDKLLGAVGARLAKAPRVAGHRVILHAALVRRLGRHVLTRPSR